MKILILVDDFLPESQKIAPNMIRDLANELVCRGHDPVVLAPKHDFGFKPNCIEQKCNEFRCIRFACGNVKHSSKIVRLISELLMPLMAFSALKNQNKKQFDAVICYSPSIFWGIFLALLKFGNRNTSVFTVLRDFFPQWVIDEGIISKLSLIHI